MKEGYSQTRQEMARKIDISCVRAFHTRQEIDQMIEAARKYRFISVFTLPAFSGYVARQLRKEPDIRTGGVVSFPGGGDTTAEKGRQARELRELGCDEIDMVMNLTAFLSGEYNYVREDILTVKENAGDLPLKVIIEAPHLSEKEIAAAVELCIEGKADFVKSSTGWYSQPTLPEHIETMCRCAGGRIAVKAAGGIRALDTIRTMEQWGCARFGLGLTSALNIMKDMN